MNASQAEDMGRAAVQMLIRGQEDSQSQEAPAAEPTDEEPAADTGALTEPERSSVDRGEAVGD
ncbi:hypothetical protein [Streptomyces sp. NPDC055134]